MGDQSKFREDPISYAKGAKIKKSQEVHGYPTKLILVTLFQRTQKINKQFNTGLKSQNKTLVSTLRLVLAAIKEQDIANRTKDKSCSCLG